MAFINENFLKLKAGYLFPEIGRRVQSFAAAHPDADIIRLGIGDVTEPLSPAITSAMHAAVEDMGHRDTFHGYGPEQGYIWLREKIAQHDYQARGCDIDAGEIIVSDGSKCDTGNILEIFSQANTIAVTDPVYPVYVDTNVMAGHTGTATEQGEFSGLVYLPATAENDFTPVLPDRPVDIIYLCYPNNPTGTVATRETLERWVEYAQAHRSIIFYDAAYEAYITDPTIPHSIFEIPGAREVAIEFRSFSKVAGFTGVRCAFTVIPQNLTARSSDGQEIRLHQLWLRRHTTKFNGVSYVTQRGAEAVYSDEGNHQVRQTVAFYLENARIIQEGLSDIGFKVYGGTNAPYLWVQTPDGIRSWDFFDQMLTQAHVVCTPGSGFGAAGEGYFRISAFNNRQNVENAVSRICNRLTY